MTKDSSGLTRRTALKLTGGLVVAGGGVAAFAGSGAAAMDSSFDAEPVSLSVDTGAVDSVYLAPRSTVEWDNFDVPVTKVRQVVMARLKRDGDVLTDTPDENPVPGADGWWPIYRNTPWLFTTGASDADFDYDGSPAAYSSDQPWSLHELEYGGNDGQKQKGTSGLLDYELNDGNRVYVAQEGESRPTDYSESTLTGTSVGDGPDRANGAYGTVDDTTTFDNPDDGTNLVTNVELGLLTTLHTDYDFAEVSAPDGVDNPDRLSPLAMGNSPDVGHAFDSDTHAITYADLYEHRNEHPAVGWVTTQYAFTTENESSDEGSQTTANTGGS